MKQHLQNGFTLIEIIVVLVIIGILAAIAVPNYQAYIRKSACEDTKTVITGAAARMERFKAQTNTYETATLDEYEEAPIDGNKKHAEIEISEPTASSYILTATGVGVLAGKGTLTLDSTGVRGGTGALANAWGSCSGI